MYMYMYMLVCTFTELCTKVNRTVFFNFEMNRCLCNCSDYQTKNF